MGAMTDSRLKLIKGTFDVLILKTLSWGPAHGYAVSRWISDSSEDELKIEEGALYPALWRSERVQRGGYAAVRGCLVSKWRLSETGREARYYEITAEGRRELRREVAAWERYVRSFTRVLSAKPTEAIA